jgi:hypothetical protein
VSVACGQPEAEQVKWQSWGKRLIPDIRGPRIVFVAGNMPVNYYKHMILLINTAFPGFGMSAGAVCAAATRQGVCEYRPAQTEE